MANRHAEQREQPFALALELLTVHVSAYVAREKSTVRHHNVSGHLQQDYSAPVVESVKTSRKSSKVKWTWTVQFSSEVTKCCLLSISIQLSIKR